MIQNKSGKTDQQCYHTCKSIVARMPSVLACSKNAGIDFARSIVNLDRSGPSLDALFAGEAPTVPHGSPRSFQ